MIDITKEVLDYHSYLRLSDFQPSAVVMYARTLEIFLTYIEKYFKGEAPSQEHAQHYLLMRVDHGKAWSTINADYTALDSIRDPTRMQTKTIELYLARYINRIAVTNTRLNYIKENN